MIRPYTQRRDARTTVQPLLAPVGMTVWSEIKKLKVSICRSIVKLETSLSKSLILQITVQPLLAPLGMTVGTEIKKHIVSTCHSVVKLETSLSKLEARSKVLEQHRIESVLYRRTCCYQEEVALILEDHQPPGGANP